MHISGSRSAKRLSEAFRDEYREHGVEPPHCPRGWWAFGLRTEEAGWPEGHREKWTPTRICSICKESIDGDAGLLLQDGPYGYEYYPTHPDCFARGGLLEGFIGEKDQVDILVDDVS